jgi:hypothetical protein
LGGHLSPRRGRSSLYLAAPLFMLAGAVAGFWPQYFGPLVTGGSLEGAARHALVHVHAALFLVWLGVIVFQVLLVRARRVALHRCLGRWLAAVGYLAALIGLFAGVGLAAAQPGRGISLESAAAFVAAPLLDMIMFTAFLTAAIAYRNRPEVHKRLILFTGYSFAFIGLVRYLSRIPGVLESLWLGTFLLALPVLLCIGWERITLGRVHPVWWIGLAAFVGRLLLELLAQLPFWQPVGRAILAPFL